jgi:hypothetical protein
MAMTNSCLLLLLLLLLDGFAEASTSFSSSASTSSSSSSSSGSCSAPAKTLTSSCDGLCASNQPCLVYNASVACNSCVTSGACQFKCIDGYGSTATGVRYFVVLVSYWSYESPEEAAARELDSDYDAEVDQLPDNSSDFAWISNSVLTSIDALELSPATTSL